MIRIGILDRNELFRLSLASLVNTFEGMSTEFNVSSIPDLEQIISTRQIDILIIDTNELGKDICQQLNSINRAYPKLKVLVLSNSLNKSIVMKLIECGINGFYSKDISSTILRQSITEIFNTYNLFDIKLGASIRKKLIEQDGFAHSIRGTERVNFSKRELEILELICSEKTNAEISNLLNLSVRTIETHRRRMIEKTESRNMIGVILRAISIHPSLIKNESLSYQAS